MSLRRDTPARKRREDKETPPRERAGLTGTTKEIKRHRDRLREEKKESGKFSVLKKNKTFDDFNKEFDELEKQQRGEDFSDDDLGLVSYDNDDEEDLGLMDYGVDNTSFRSITDEKEKEENERRKTLEKKHIKKEKTCTLEDCTISWGTKRRKRSKSKKTKRRKRKSRRRKTRNNRGGGIGRPSENRDQQPLDSVEQRVRNFSDLIIAIGIQINRGESINDNVFNNILNIGRGDLNDALLEMFPIERGGSRDVSIRFLTQIRDTVDNIVIPITEEQRLNKGQLLAALNDIIGSYR